MRFSALLVVIALAVAVAVSAAPQPSSSPLVSGTPTEATQPDAVSEDEARRLRRLRIFGSEENIAALAELYKTMQAERPEREARVEKLVREMEQARSSRAAARGVGGEDDFPVYPGEYPDPYFQPLDEEPYCLAPSKPISFPEDWEYLPGSWCAPRCVYHGAKNWTSNCPQPLDPVANPATCSLSMPDPSGFAHYCGIICNGGWDCGWQNIHGTCKKMPGEEHLPGVCTHP